MFKRDLMNTICDQDQANINLTVYRHGEWLIAKFLETQRMLSWAVHNAGQTINQYVAWNSVNTEELSKSINPETYYIQKSIKDDIPDAVGLLTSADLDGYTQITKSFGPYEAHCVATVGMGNALRVGDRPTAANMVGTINVLASISASLSDDAMLEAMSIATEARTSAVIDSGVKSIRTNKQATGTGTDCIVIASSALKPGSKYAGKHTIIGHLIGSCVYKAVSVGIDKWKDKKEYAAIV